MTISGARFKAQTTAAAVDGLETGGDGITIANIPPNLDVYAGYTGGSWPTYNPLVALTPKKLHLAYAINARSWGDCLDDEPGDATPEQVEGWMDNVWKPVNTPLPAAYTSASVMGAMLQRITRPRTSFLLLSAHYTGVPHICSSAVCWPSSPVPWTADGTQYSDNGGRWDALLFQDYFFIASMPVTPPPVPTPVLAPTTGPAYPLKGQAPLMIVPFAVTTGTDGSAYIPIILPAGCTQVLFGSADVENASTFTPHHHDVDVTAAAPAGGNCAPAVGSTPALRMVGYGPSKYYTGRVVCG